MKLQGFDEESGRYTFRLEAPERDWFKQVLQSFPVQQTPLQAAGVAPNEVIEKALAAGREKQKQEAEIFLRAGKMEIDADFNEFWDLTLSVGEVEALLQILNNIRVGTWVRLGKPDPRLETPLPEAPEEEMVRAHMMMHACAAWQGTLMAAVDPEMPTE